MKSACIIILAILCVFSVTAQQADKLIAKGNEAYKLQQYDKAASAYKEALQIEPGNPTASFNLGNALFKDKKFEEASLQFDALARTSTDKAMQAKSLYNKGVANTQQKKLEESIEAYKQSLKLNNADSFTRENLQRALNEKKQQQKQEQPENNQQQQKKQEQQQQPTPSPNKLNQQQVQTLLKALEEQEKKLQEKVMKKPPVPGQPDKDW